MPVPSSVWVSTNDGRITPITGVSDWKWLTWPEADVLYRDNAGTPGTAVHAATGVANAGELATVPVMGKDGLGVPTSFDTTNIFYVASDEASHTPHRRKPTEVTGLVVTVGGVILPVPLFGNGDYGRLLLTDPIGVAISAGDVTANQVTTSQPHYLITGDKIYLSATATMPGGVTQQLYGVQRINTLQISLINLITNAIVDITSAGSGVILQLAQPAPRQILPQQLCSANAATETFTLATDSSAGLLTGDLVYITGDTLPGGVTGGATYEVLSLGLLSFQLREVATKALVALSTAGTNLKVNLVTPVSYTRNQVIDLSGISGLIKFPVSLEPEIATVAPA